MAYDQNPHGKKRPAECDPDEQPLTKKFGYLQIGNEASLSASVYTSPRFPSPDTMLLDDTEHTTYIYDLDQELAEPEPTDHLVILPLAARIMSTPVRESVLSNPVQGKELVLYSDPSSLTIPKEQDSVRRAIIESRTRARAREKEREKKSERNQNDTLDNLSTEYVDDPMDIE